MKNKLVEKQCLRGCGKIVTALSRSLWGMKDEVRQKYAFICHDCLTDKERGELIDAIGRQISNYEKHRQHH